jgi:hypothetical protein
MLVVPTVRPVITPLASTDTTEGVALVHVPPAGELAKVPVAPRHTYGVPLIADGRESTLSASV